MPWASPGSPLSNIGRQLEPPVKQGIDNGSYVRIEPDNMIAWLYLLPPVTEGEKFTKEDIMEFLQKRRGARFSYIQYCRSGQKGSL